MKVSAEMKYLGAEMGTSNAGKPYWVVAMLQGFDSTRFYVQESLFNFTKDLKPMDLCLCDLSISDGRDKEGNFRTYVNLNGITPVTKTK